MAEKTYDLVSLAKKDPDTVLHILDSPLQWAENFLIEPNTNELFKANTVERTILSAKGEWVVIRVPRRQGKSYSLAVLILWSVILHPNYEVLVLAPEQGQVGDMFDYVRNFLLANPALAGEIMENSKSPQRIIFSNGSSIKGKTTGTASNRQGRGVRGKGADLIVIDEAAYLRDADFGAILPIVTNAIYKEKVRVFAASTPTADYGRYRSWCLDPDKTEWERIHIPITEIPEVTPDRLAMIRSMHSDLEWITEDLAEFPDVGDNVFRNMDIDAAKVRYSYSLDSFTPGSVRVMGVDWDKYSSGVNIVILEMVPGLSTIRVAYREEIPKGDYTLTKSVNRIIGLNELVRPDMIYVDRGYGEQQVETLKLYGLRNKSSQLHTKIRGIQFSEKVPIFDPVLGIPIDKPFKAVMINTLMKFFEDRMLIFSDRDAVFEKQLRSYKILGLSANQIQTTKKNEHIIDAVGLALFGIWSAYKDDLRPTKATKIAVTKTPAVVPSLRTVRLERDRLKGLGAVHTNRSYTRGFVRGTIGSKPPSRTFT